ncbi:restriction endonuclease subunit S [Streptococcus suis]|uniref:restriction endonuclease subunit S n=1 Tax=Streptococcus suis TaxID=1307 RepID=UPI00041A5DDB|nr:restriction endonuclease subunit S [Streptococcus suis]MCQ9224582.1 restriction endonuclease subunit S [Streptococcus suis]MCQ9230812.1 restriction endonuclease subunit S [Streptococcus suis]NQH64729.1 restriction endonuclease subunit S [Streptococcus suis]NQI18651.1 restriction endonuclease subunit S [Streptococcus suis]NQI76298.1 restriction endonuclease subunit S [Streptococcus suis]
MSEVRWQIKSLSELGRFSRGKSKHRPRNDKKLFTNGTYPLIQTGDIKNSNLYVTKNSDYYNEFGLSQSKLWKQGTLCITIAANIAETAILSYPMCFPDSVVGFNAHKNESSELFVYYVFELIKKEIQKTSSGSIQDNINIDYLTKLKLKVPNKDYQDRIVNLLSTIDKKILINNQINEELEAMAKTLYDYWFVQFDFPDENGKPYKSSGGKMVYNDQLKREIPEGWGVKQLGEICEFRNGINYEKSETGDTLSKIVNVRNISNSSTFVTTHDLDSIALDRRRIESYLVTDRTILITRSGIPGATRIVSDIPVNTIYSGFIIGATVANLNLFYYVFYHLKNIEMLMSNQSAGTIMKNISQATLSEIRIAIPNKEIQKVFSNEVRSLLDVIENNLKQNQELTQLRDWLLPMLMNGQVKVEDKIWKL